MHWTYKSLVVLITALIIGCSEIPSAQAGVCPQDCTVPPILTPDPFPRPFASDSIWNRAIPPNAEFADISDALFGDPAQIITLLGVDVVVACYSDPNEPLVQIQRSLGWSYPERACSSGEVLYSRHLAADACTGVSWIPTGNALFNIIDPITGLADENVAAWRCPRGPLLAFLGDNPEAHNIDIVNGDGLIGEGRGSGLVALGGALRQGELNNGIPHALAVNMNARRFSQDLHFIWPASQADGFADDPVQGYHGPNRHYTMGTLLAIPPDVDLALLTWNTPQGFNMAVAAQTYGMYVVDDSAMSNAMQMGIEVRAAIADTGFAVDPVTGEQTVDPLLIDEVGFEADVMAIQSLVQAVVSNAPNGAGVPTIAQGGMMVMVLLLLTAGTVVFRHRGSRVTSRGFVDSCRSSRRVERDTRAAVR
ncbi:MAG: hypothetical protein ACE5E5_04705 [Phycisphaerae bacterium]